MVGVAHTEAMNPAVLAGVFMQSFFFFFRGFNQPFSFMIVPTWLRPERRSSMGSEHGRSGHGRITRLACKQKPRRVYAAGVCWLQVFYAATFSGGPLIKRIRNILIGEGKKGPQCRKFPEVVHRKRSGVSKGEKMQRYRKPDTV